MSGPKNLIGIFLALSLSQIGQTFAAPMAPPDSGRDYLPSVMERMPGVGTEIRQKLDRIIGNLKAGRREAAQKELDDYLATKPENPLAFEIKATLLMEDGKLEEAEKLMESVVFADPDSGTARAKLGALQLRLGKTAAGLESLKRTLQIDPQNTYAHETLGLLEASRGNDDAAIAHFRSIFPQIITSDTQLHPLHVRTATLLNRSGRPDETVALLSGRLAGSDNKSLRQNAYLQLIAAYIAERNVTGAENALSESASLFDKSDARHPIARSSLLQLKGDTEGAIKLITSVRSDDPDTRFQLHMIGANLLRQNKSYGLAVREYEAALKVSAGDGRTPSVLRELSMSLLQNGQRTQAIKVLEDGAAKHPDQPAIGLTLASLEALTGDRGSALARLAELTKSHPEFAPVRDLRAQLLLASGKKKEAYGELKAATRLAPANIGYWIALSELAHDVEGHDAVQRVLRDGLKANPEQPDLLYDLALIDNEEGRKPAANNAFRMILRANPNHVPTLISLSENLATDPATRDDALEMATRARSLKPGDPFTQNGYGWILHLAGKTQEALPLLEATVATLPQQAVPKYRLAAAYAALGRTADSKMLAAQALRQGLHNPEKAAAQKLVR